MYSHKYTRDELISDPAKQEEVERSNNAYVKMLKKMDEIYPRVKK